MSYLATFAAFLSAIALVDSAARRARQHRRERNWAAQRAGWRRAAAASRRQFDERLTAELDQILSEG